MIHGITRRELLFGATATALVLPRVARAFGDIALVTIAELDLGAGTTSRPDAWERLLLEVEQTTSVECDAKIARVDPASDELFKHPFTVLVGASDFALPGDHALEQLSRYLSYGGFLFIDETSGSESSGFDRSVRKLCDVLFPTRPLAPLPSGHSVYRSFFLIDRPVGRIARHSRMEGITVGGMEGHGGYSPLMYSRNDVSGALDRASNGEDRNPCEPGGERQRREAIKLSTNLVLYSLTTDYKKDQAHVKALMDDNRLNFEWDDP